ncbi:MAG: outer membrane protein assembly factor BamD [Gemmatimonadetes bacterium]|nr:outer membrane protein assembly factor BamD [Gemmatimonadota bacterium]
MRQRLFRWTCICALAGCSGGFNPLRYSSSQELLADSEERFRRGDCGNAALGFRRVTTQLPVRDSLGVRARFLLAECHFATAEFLEAARQFRRVANEAPTHPLARRALLRAGDSQARLWTQPELDPTYGEVAKVTYEEVIARYPRTAVSNRASLKLAALAERFAEKEYKNGNHYFRLRATFSAILYYKVVVADYGATSYAPRALIKLVEAYIRLDYQEEKRETCSNLRRFYPDAPRLDDVCPAEGGMP